MMLRYIPDFILQQYEKQQLAGSFRGYALFFDIADFTPIGTQLQKHGKEGAEELSRFLDFVFGEPIRIVEDYGGFVSLFAGDAFCAIFPETSGLGILAAINAIKEFFKDQESYHTPLGDFALKVRQVASYGEIHWQIYDNLIQNEYVFYGDALADMAKLSSKKEDCIFSVEAASQLGLEHFEAIDTGYQPITKRISAEPINISYPHSSETYSHFIQQRLREQKPDNEIRSAAFCFASLEAIPRDVRNEAISKLATLSLNYGAYINKLDATDKGLTALILFGLPRSEGKTLERICSFALEAVETLPLLALGISCGSVFAGYTGRGEISEYTAYGHPLNLAARLMSKAIAGEVLTDTYLWLELHAAYDFGYLGSLGLKGIDYAVRYYRLKRKTHGKRDENRFVGRDTELNSIRDTIDQALAAKGNIILYVSGDAGIGKSRLVSEALAIYGQQKRNSASQCLLYFITCDAIIRKPLEAIKQMLRSQFYYNPALPMEAAIPMFRALWSTISPGDNEMQRIESFLASLLGYEWEGSIWSMLPPEERPKQLKNAFVYFIRKLCQSKAILIHLDDGQWLDEESQSYFQALSEAEISPVIFVSPCRYLEDGSKADLQLSKYRRIDWELDSLGEKGCLELTKSIMRLNEIPSATLELISNRSMGNPLFIEQLSSYLMETGSLNAKGEIVKELGYLSSFSISDIVSNRIDRLTDKVKECLFGASVLGMEFDIRVLSEMLKTDLTKELEAGTQSRIWKDLDELRYIFSHILIKDIVYQRMMTDKLKELHRLAAEAMEIVYKDTLDENAEEIALHYEKAGTEVKAAEYYDKAGVWFNKTYDYVNSQLYLSKALEVRERVLGAKHPDTASTLHDLAKVFVFLYKYTEAEHLYLRSLQIKEKVLGKEHPEIATSLTMLAHVYLKQYKFELAESLYIRALTIREKVFGFEDLNTASSLNDLANCYERQGRYTKAESLYTQALAIYEKDLGIEYQRTAASLNGIYYYQGNHAKMELISLRTLKIMERKLGVGHLNTLGSIASLSFAYRVQDKLSEMESLSSRVLVIMEKMLGQEQPDIYKLELMAGVLLLMQKYVEAELSYMKAIQFWEKVFGVECLGVARLSTGLAKIYFSQGKYTQAEHILIKATAIEEKILGANNPYVASDALNSMARLYETLERYTEAENLFLRILEVYKAFYDHKHPFTLNTIKRIINLYEKMNQPDKAVYYRSMLQEEHSGT